MALLKDGEALGRFLTMVVVDEVDSRLDCRLGEVFGVGGMWAEEEILGRVFPRLDMEDAVFYRELSEGQVLHDNIEALSRSFRTVWKSAMLEEVSPVAEGIITNERESDNFYVITLGNSSYIGVIGLPGIMSSESGLVCLTGTRWATLRCRKSPTFGRHRREKGSAIAL